MSAGLVLGGRYRLVSQLGEGGFGSVWRGHDSRLARDVAVKLLHAGVDVPRFQREAHALAALSHPNIVAAYDFGIDGTAAYLVLELITGRTVGDELAAARAAGVAGLPVDRVLHVADQVLAGLGAAHNAGLIHRDLKPANVMAVSGGPEIKIVDFGIARSRDASRMTAVGSVLGTLPYMAPEQFDDGPLDGRVDLYSLGCVLHELLTGASPYQAANTAAWIKAHNLQRPGHVRDRRPEVPEAIDSFVQLLLTKDPGGRPANAAAARAIIAGLPRIPAVAMPGSPPPGSPPPGTPAPARSVGVSRVVSVPKAIVCRKCGHASPLGTEFCPKPGCGDYLGWASQMFTSSAPMPPPGAHTQKSAATVRLSASDLTVAPGATVTTTATVHNGGSQIEEFAVSVAGTAAAWTSVEPATLRIFPGEQAECVVRFTPPRHASVVSGRSPFTVSASSKVHPALAARADGTLEVGAFHDLRATLAPAQTRGRGRTVHTIEFANEGNVSEAVRVTAADRTATVRFGLPAAEVWIPPGSMAVDMPVTPRRRLFGRPRTYQFQVTATPTNPAVPVPGQATPPAGTPVPLRLDGTRESLAFIPGWVPGIVVTLAVLLAAGVGAMAATHTGLFKEASTVTTTTPPPTPTPTITVTTSASQSQPPATPPDQLLAQAIRNTGNTTLDFHLTLTGQGDMQGLVIDGQYQPDTGAAFYGPDPTGNTSGQLTNQYVATGNDLYLLCGPSVESPQCPLHVTMNRPLSDQHSGILLLADPLFALRLLETATAVTAPSDSYTGTCDLSGVNNVSPAAKQFADLLVKSNFVATDCEATHDASNQLTTFHAVFDDHSGDLLTYDETLSRFGSQVSVTLPDPSQVVEADDSWYADSASPTPSPTS